MEKIHCIICGEESGRINPVCQECMKKANISKKTMQAIEKLDLALEVIAGAEK